jgi:iron complex outermembrane receptor protein
MKKRLWAGASVPAMAFAVAASMSTAALAQGAAGTLRDEILVTATKKADAENVQDVPLAVTAYGADQLDALKVRDLQSLSYAMPNVQLDDLGTVKGIANFSIRGLGINSSIPSIDPTVGVFVDGVYLGVNMGVVLDIFDLESVEVLRGPQGILFGRNTTGGAVLINTKKPGDDWEGSIKGAVESGFNGGGANYYAMGSVGGPLIEGVLRAKVAAYYNKDEGYFRNYLGGPVPNALANVVFGPIIGGLVAGPGVDAFEDIGQSETVLIRPVLNWTPTDSFEATFRYEYGDVNGPGPVGQNHASGLGTPNIFFTAPRNTFQMSINEPGFTNANWHQASADLRLDLGAGGVFTNIFGWRDLEQVTRGDIDGTPLTLFHADTTLDQDQVSNELRYNNRLFDRVDLTLGFYYFSQDIAYNEIRRVLGGFRFFNGGGVQDQKTVAGFGQIDIDLSDKFTLNFGARYTHEEKDVVISNLILNSNTPAVMNPSPVCDVRIAGDCTEDFVDSESWNNFTPKIGFEWRPVDFMNVYAHWTQGVRSGGYNFRNTSLASVPELAPGVPNPAFNPLFLPGPFDEETVNAYEIGFKAQPGEGRLTLNAAVYLNDISDMQRELNLADPLTGVVQVIRNTADATIWGIEIETLYAVTENFVVTGNLGHTQGEYDSLLFDIGAPAVSPGVIDAADLALEIPRLAPWTWGLGFVHSMSLTNALSVDTRFNYSHRDASFYTDNNLGTLNEVDLIDASVALNFGKATLSIYGKNLLNEVNFGQDTQLPASLGGGAVGPFQKGRVAGVELQVSF